MSAIDGWYPDPSDEGLLRWWDGQRWSTATAPAPASPGHVREEAALREVAGPTHPGRRISADQFLTYKAKAERGAPEVNHDADQSHPLFDRVIVFSGELARFPQRRHEAEQLAADRGARVEPNFTRRTHYFVAGTPAPGSLKPGQEITTKHSKALAAASDGRDLVILDERALLDLLDID